MKYSVNNFIRLSLELCGLFIDIGKMAFYHFYLNDEVTCKAIFRSHLKLKKNNILFAITVATKPSLSSVSYTVTSVNSLWTSIIIKQMCISERDVDFRVNFSRK